MTDLMELASRVEAGEGDTREIFEEAYTAIHGMSWQAAAYHHGSLGSEPDRAKQETAFRFGELVRVWAWLDAAMSLVPADHTVQLSDWDHEVLREKGPWQAIVLPLGARGAMQQFTFTNRCDHAATAPLALTAAALRARAHQGAAHVD